MSKCWNESHPIFYNVFNDKHKTHLLNLTNVDMAGNRFHTERFLTRRWFNEVQPCNEIRRMRRHKYAFRIREIKEVFPLLHIRSKESIMVWIMAGRIGVRKIVPHVCLSHSLLLPKSLSTQSVEVTLGERQRAQVVQTVTSSPAADKGHKEQRMTPRESEKCASVCVCCLLYYLPFSSSDFNKGKGIS